MFVNPLYPPLEYPTTPDTTSVNGMSPEKTRVKSVRHVLVPADIRSEMVEHNTGVAVNNPMSIGPALLDHSEKQTDKHIPIEESLFYRTYLDHAVAKKQHETTVRNVDTILRQFVSSRDIQGRSLSSVCTLECIVR